MKKIDNPDRKNWKSLLQRTMLATDEITETVNAIFGEVRDTGDRALKKYTHKFDGIALGSFKVTAAELDHATNFVADDLKKAIDIARANIEKFHRAQQTKKTVVQTMEGVECWQEKRPIQKVGLYVPGGTAPLFSTVLMLAIPAQIAGCQEVILCTPPNDEGKVHPAILYTARLCGVTKIFKLGGVQAIAALTFGTETVPAVYKIFGPGNQFVTKAKQEAIKYGIAIDMPAGPSELLVVADDSANAAYVASDLLSQAEHGPDSQVILVGRSKQLLVQIEVELEKQIEQLPRKAIAKQAMANSKMIFVDNDDTAIDLINYYAPEHYIVCTRNAAVYIERVHNAGSVFIGNFTPESAGDYASGTNHTLPTHGFARQYSGVNLDSFQKSITFQKISEIGIQNLGPVVQQMAAEEQLWAHKNAVTLRLNDLNGKTL
ncbi:MAG: histidinol dehydrogenase [Bacteroidota bacterium]